MIKISLKRRRLARLKWYLLLVILSLPLFAQNAFAQTLKSSKFAIEQGVTGARVQTTATPITIALSTDFIDYGQLSPTNPIKREISIATEGTDKLFVFQNHPLLAQINAANEIVPDTTCDSGGCTEFISTTWINPFTFGLGFSFDDRSYQQFADTPTASITPRKMTIKLNVNQTQKLGSYTHTLTFWAIPRL